MPNCFSEFCLRGPMMKSSSSRQVCFPPACSRLRSCHGVAEDGLCIFVAECEASCSCLVAQGRIKVRDNVLEVKENGMISFSLIGLITYLYKLVSLGIGPFELALS